VAGATGPDRLSPDQVPDDTTGGQLAGWIAEDVARYLAARLAALAACVAVVAGALSESASTGLKATSATAGGVGLFVLLGTGLLRARRTRQWWVIGIVLATCAALLAAIWLGST